MFADALIFIAVIVGAVVVSLLWKIGPPWYWREYFSTETGRGVLRGIILAPLVIVIIGLLLMMLPNNSRAGEWINDASVYAGLDQTKKLSPMCDANIVDDRLTSNLGFRVGVWRSDSRRVSVNARYTHHSCAIGSDDRQYDGVGIEAEWKVWKR